MIFTPLRLDTLNWIWNVSQNDNKAVKNNLPKQTRVVAPSSGAQVHMADLIILRFDCMHVYAHVCAFMHVNSASSTRRYFPRRSNFLRCV